MVIDNLPKYQSGGDKPLCDVCKKKGKNVQPAVMYCTVCCKKYCKKHEEVSLACPYDYKSVAILARGRRVTRASPPPPSLSPSHKQIN